MSRDYTLPYGQPVSLPADSRPVLLHCRQGMIWATVSGSTHDIVLRAGEQHTIHAPGHVVVEAISLDDAELAVSCEEPGRCPDPLRALPSDSRGEGTPSLDPHMCSGAVRTAQLPSRWSHSLRS